jgi:RNA polymerase primary sigma factor
VTQGEDNRLLDYLADRTERGSDTEAFEHALSEHIDASFRALREREARILRLYYGLDRPEAMTLEEIGAMLGITRERVRQIKEKALARLRGASEAEALATFL